MTLRVVTLRYADGNCMAWSHETSRLQGDVSQVAASRARHNCSISERGRSRPLKGIYISGFF